MINLFRFQKLVLWLKSLINEKHLENEGHDFVVSMSQHYYSSQNTICNNNDATRNAASSLEVLYLLKEVTHTVGTSYNLELSRRHAATFPVSHNPKYMPDHKFNGVNQTA